jgi:hypothetical protein
MATGIAGLAQRAIAVVVLAGSVTACTAGPRSATDCGRHVTSGSGLLGLMGATGAFDRPAGPECREPVFARAAGVTPSPIIEPVVEPAAPLLPQLPELPPPPDMRPKLLVPAGGGALMELGGGAPHLIVPAGSGAFMALP